VRKRTADLNLACSGSLEEIREVGDDDEIKEARRALFTSVTMATEQGRKATRPQGCTHEFAELTPDAKMALLLLLRTEEQISDLQQPPCFENCNNGLIPLNLREKLSNALFCTYCTGKIDWIPWEVQNTYDCSFNLKHYVFIHERLYNGPNNPCPNE